MANVAVRRSKGVSVSSSSFPVGFTDRDGWFNECETDFPTRLPSIEDKLMSQRLCSHLTDLAMARE
jgi:hypothetical protein